MADSLYFENGYADVGYVLRIIDAGNIGGRYVDDTYAVDDYLEIGDSISFSLTADAILNPIIEGSATLASSASLSATGGFIISPPASDFTWDEQDTSWDDWQGEIWEPTKFYMVAQFDVSADAVEISGPIALSSAFTVSATAGLQKIASANLSSAVSLTATPSLILEGESNPSSAFSLTADGRSYDFAICNLFGSVTLSASPTLIFDGESSLSSEFTVDADSFVSKIGSSSLSSAFSVTADGDNFKVATANLSSAFTLTASGQHSDRGNANLASSFGLTATPILKFDQTVSTSSAFTLDVSEQIFQIGGANLSSQFALTASGNYVFGVPAYHKLTVPSETRIAQILPESGILTVESETRINTVLPENRAFTIKQETRKYSVDGS